MGAIARDPTLHNMASGYATFCDLAKAGHEARCMGFHARNGDVCRFAARFRVAKSWFTRRICGDISVLNRVQFAWK